MTRMVVRFAPPGTVLKAVDAHCPVLNLATAAIPVETTLEAA